MKKTLKSIAGLCVLATAVCAQESGVPRTATTTDTSRSVTTRDNGQSQKFCRSKDLVGATVKDAQGQKLGSVDELLINPQNGETLASIGVTGGRYALVPIHAFTVTRGAGVLRNAELTLNATKESLQSGPTVAKNEWQKLDDSTFTQSIYSHYKLQPPSAMGGVGTSSIEGASTGVGTSSTNYPVQPRR